MAEWRGSRAALDPGLPLTRLGAQLAEHVPMGYRCRSLLLYSLTVLTGVSEHSVQYPDQFIMAVHSTQPRSSSPLSLPLNSFYASLGARGAGRLSVRTGGRSRHVGTHAQIGRHVERRGAAGRWLRRDVRLLENERQQIATNYVVIRRNSAYF